MTQAEAGKIIYTIKASYPSHFENMTNDDIKNMVRVWAGLFRDKSYEQISMGLEIYLMSETKGFPPSPGQIVDCIQKAKPQEMTDAEAWGLVRKAIRNGIYGAEEEYAKLPDDCQRAVGRPGQLTEWALMSSESVDVTAAAHFKRTYRTLMERKREDAKIPQSIRDRLAAASQEALIDSRG